MRRVRHFGDWRLSRGILKEISLRTDRDFCLTVDLNTLAGYTLAT